jgi:hypothetical protein
MVSKTEDNTPKKLILPTNVITPPDIGKLVNELVIIENSLLQLQVRDSGSKVELPPIGERMEKVVELNGINLLQDGDRKLLQTLLLGVKDKAPRLHISFSSEPSTIFLEKLITWLRREINPQIILTIGLQPTIGAGCMLRTTNKYFDLSLRHTFSEKRSLLLEQLIPAVSEVPSA